MKSIENDTNFNQLQCLKVKAIFSQPHTATRFSEFGVICTHPWAIMGGDMNSKQMVRIKCLADAVHVLWAILISRQCRKTN